MGMTEYMMAQQKTRSLEQTVTSYQIKVANLQGQLNIARATGTEEDVAKAQAKLDSATKLLDDYNADLVTARAEEKAALEDDQTNPTTTIKSPEATNPPQSDQKTAEAYSDPSKTPEAPSYTQYDDGSSRQVMEDGSVLVIDSEGKVSSTPAPSEDTNARQASLKDAGNKAISRGAETPKTKSATAQWAGAKDLRVFLRVPQSYLTGEITGKLSEFGGILFPYTPEISFENQASYTAVNPVHTNYTQYFFKNSSIGSITVTGKFTVQNEKEGIIWLSVVHLLRALTKMRWGDDANAGAPPPVCRLEGYGDLMLRNVPVVLQSFKVELPQNVDYMSVTKGKFATTLVPTVSTISLTLNTMYSRKELQDFSVDKWLGGNLKGKGYL